MRPRDADIARVDTRDVRAECGGDVARLVAATVEHDDHAHFFSQQLMMVRRAPGGSHARADMRGFVMSRDDYGKHGDSVLILWFIGSQSRDCFEVQQWVYPCARGEARNRS